MTRQDAFRRYPDGAIDFDFYRRRALRLRHGARRIAFKRCGRAIGRMAAAIVAALRGATTAKAGHHPVPSVTNSVSPPA